MDDIIETRSEQEKGSTGSHTLWSKELDSANREEKQYREDAVRLQKKYASEEQTEFNIFWSNTETLKPALYSNTANPDVRRRFTTADPLGRQMSIMLERAVKYSCDEYDFDDEIRMVRDDALITGRGVGRIVYEPEMVQRMESGYVMQPDGSEIFEERSIDEIGSQQVKVQGVAWDDFRMSPAKCWRDVRWVAFRHRPTRDELVDQFGNEIGQKVPLTHTLLNADEDEDGHLDAVFRRASVWEIWDKEKAKRVWYCDSYKQILDKEDDPYGLKEFFPCPKPFYVYKKPGSMVPRSEYMVYQRQAEELNRISSRLRMLSNELKVKGMYNAVNEEVQKLLEAGNNDFIPVQGVDGTAVKDMVYFWDITQIAQVMVSLQQAREVTIQNIYQITGISDIVRGSTKASETATAQQLKGNFATLRMNPRQQPFNEFVRDIFRLKAEIIAEHYTAENLTQMTQIPVDEQMIMTLRSDKLRSYRIDVESDSTVAADADADKQRRIEFLEATTSFISAMAPLVQGGGLSPDVAKAMLSFGVRGFKIGRELEDALDSIGEAKPGQLPQQQNEATQPDAMAEIKAQEVQAKLQIDAQKLQLDAQESAMDAQISEQELAVKREELELKKLEMLRQPAIY